MTDIQSSQPSEYQNDTIIRNEILNAAHDVAECRLAYQKQTDTIQGVISDLHASLATSESFSGASSVQHPFSAPLIDRKYYHAENTRQKNWTRQEKKRYVCGQFGCCSANYSSKSQLQPMKKNKALRQFIAELSGGSDDEERDLVEAFEDGTEYVLHLSVPENDNSKDNSVHSHLARLDDFEKASAFIATSQDTIIAHLLSEITVKPRFAEKFYGIMIATDFAWELQRSYFLLEISGCHLTFI